MISLYNFYIEFHTFFARGLLNSPINDAMALSGSTLIESNVEKPVNFVGDNRFLKNKIPFKR
jgi:hypothetical protein